MSSNHLVEFVIARFNESIEWTGGLPGKVVVYNKGEPLPSACETLPNIGRESHTYLTHIIRRYREVTGIVVFCQGSSFDHAPGLRDFTPPQNSFGLMTRRILTCGFDGSPHHPGLEIDDFWERLFGAEVKPAALEFGAGAIFYVTAEAIRNRPLEFYQRALDLHHQIEKAPWIMERLWKYVFVNEDQASG